MRKQFTLCLIVQNGKVLLGMKKRGFGEGRWNGFGGKVEEGESIVVGAARELKEEIGIDVAVQDIHKVGNLEFSFDSEPNKILEVHVYKINTFSGEPVETEEMRPEWFTFDSIPYEGMWSDDAHWLPLLLADKKFIGKFHFDKPSDANYSAIILSKDLKEVDMITE